MFSSRYPHRSQPMGKAFAALSLIFTFALVVPAGADTSVLPKGTNLSSLVVINNGNLANSAQQILIATLQGIVARKSGSQIYIDGGTGYTLWRNHLARA